MTNKKKSDFDKHSFAAKNRKKSSEDDQLLFGAKRSGILTDEAQKAEKDFSPVRHGRIQDAGSIVRKQAEVFLENYERYIERTSGP